MNIIHTSKAPEAIGPYSQAIMVGNTLYSSWQIGLLPLTMQMVEGGIEAEIKQVCENLWYVLQSAWFDFKNVVKTTLFLQNIEDFPKVNEIYGQYFAHKPARSTVAVAKLPRGALVEIEVIAVKE